MSKKAPTREVRRFPGISDLQATRIPTVSSDTKTPKQCSLNSSPVMAGAPFFALFAKSGAFLTFVFALKAFGAGVSVMLQHERDARAYIVPYHPTCFQKHAAQTD